jgi:FlaA1/EpsC-like NDP-sugar epimerase
LASHQRPDHPVEVIGLRPGEKQHEVLFEHPPGRPSKISGVGLDQVDSVA